MRWCQLCLLVSLPGLRFEPSNGTLAAPHRRLSNNFMEVAKLVASDAAADDGFGESVAIDGNTVVIWQYGTEGPTRGSGYVFRTSDGGATYDEVAKLTIGYFEHFGESVAIDGDTIVIGARYDDYGDAGHSGSVYVFRTTDGGATYGQVAKLKAGDRMHGDEFGNSVAIDGGTIVVGAVFDDDACADGIYDCNSGSVYVFRTTDGGATYGQVAKLTASDAASMDFFGNSVAIDGGTIVVGAYGAGTGGAAYVFRTTDGATYGQVAKLTASDAAARDHFGNSVAIDGATVVVGADDDDDGGTDSGSAYVFRTTDGGATYVEVAKLTAADAAEGDNFGLSLAIDGATIVIGAYQPGVYDNDVHAYMGTGSGAAYVFRTTDGGATYEQAAKLTASDAAADDYFGWSVAIDGGNIVVGAKFDDHGSAYIFSSNLCPPGSFSDSGLQDSAGQCTVCAASTYQPLSGQSSCDPCAAGRFSAEDGVAGDCEACPAGRSQPASGQLQCNICRPGTFSIDGQSECALCPAGRFSAEDGAGDCEACPAGRSHPASGQSECSNTECPPGTYAPAGSASCDHCPYNTFSSTSGAAACDPCPNDMRAGLGQTFCSRCLPGEGEHVAEDGLTITCLKCQTGTFSPLGLYCEVPPLGWYTPDAVQNLPCAAGSFANETYATSCTVCPAGRSQPASGQRECIECPPETYQPEAGRLGCEPCAAFQLGRGSRSGAVSCDYCGAGLYLGDDSSASDGKRCFACPAHADCKTGTTLETLNIHPGYWRTGRTSPKLKRCFLESACVGGNASQCAPGYHKTLCASCEHNYYLEVSTGECHECDGAAKRRTKHFFGLHLFLLLLFCASPFVVARFLRARAHVAAKRRFRSKRSERWWSRSAKALLPKVGRVVPATGETITYVGHIHDVFGVADEDIVNALSAFGRVRDINWSHSERPAITLDVKAGSEPPVQLQIGGWTHLATWQCRRPPWDEENLVGIAVRQCVAADANVPQTPSNSTAPERDIPQTHDDADLAREAPKIHLREPTNASLDLDARPSLDANVASVLRLIEEALVVKVKIVVTFLQCMCYLPEVYYAVTWPKQLTRLLNFFNPLNLDLFSLVQLECLVGRLTFYHRLLVVTLGPICVALALCAAARVARRRERPADAAAFIDLVLKLCFFVFASTSTSIFQAFACDDTFDDGRAVLAADYSISCKTDRWRGFAAYAGIMVAVYPVGIVCLFSALLFKHRKAIDPPLGPHGAKLLRLEETLRVERNKRCSLAERCKHAQRREDASLKSVRFLFVHYLPMYWYFEAIESVRRLLVTAVAVTVQPGSSTQLAFGLLTSILSLLLYAVTRPFINNSDNTLAILAATVLTLATFSGLLLSSDVVKDDGWSVLGMGTFLAICTALVVVLGLTLAVLEAKRLLEKLANVTAASHRRSVE